MNDKAERSAAAKSLSIAGWNLVSRVTGVGRAVVIAAVLGPAFLGNVYQATNLIPYLVYEFLTGSLIAPLLVPKLVLLIDAGDQQAEEHFAGGLLGATALSFSAIAVCSMIASPLIMSAVSLGVEDPDVASRQNQVGSVLLIMLLPQAVFYGIAGAAAAMLIARERFVLPAAGPAVENVVTIGVLIALGTTFDGGLTLAEVSAPQLLFLGLGSTGAVLVHAAMMIIGVRRTGIRPIPRAGWRDAQVRALYKEALPSVGQAGVSTLRVLASVTVANRVPGGVIAFDLARKFYYFPIAIGARPISLALLAQLSRRYLAMQHERFREELVQGASILLFVTLPAVVFYVAMAVPIAQGVSFGEMADPRGIELVALAVAAISPGISGEAMFVLATHASYSQDDRASAFRAMILRAGVSLIGMFLALRLPPGPVTLVVLGLSLSTGDLLASGYLTRCVMRRLPAGGPSLWSAWSRTTFPALLMLLPAYFVWWLTTSISHTGWVRPLGLALAGTTAIGTFVAVQRSIGSPELKWLLEGVKLPTRRTGTV